MFNPPEELVHLNWAGFTGRDGGWGVGDSYWWAKVLRLIIIAFPCLDLPNVFPIVAFSLAGNIEQAIKATSLPMPKREKVLRTFTRFVAAVPPLIAGAFLGSAAVVFTFAGLFACWLSYNFPPLMQIFGKRKCIKTFGPNSEKTSISGRLHSSSILAWITFGVGAIAWVISVVLFIMDLVNPSKPNSNQEESSVSSF